VIIRLSHIRLVIHIEQFILLLGMSFVLVSCQNASDSGEEILATVGPNTLKRKDLSRYLPEIWENEEDSLRATKQFIEQWISEQVMTDQALGEIDGLEGKIEFKVKDYRNRLILNEYYQYLIQTRLDTVIDSANFSSYFSKHPEKYKAEEPYYQIIYLGTHVLNIQKPVQFLANKPEEMNLNNLKLWCMENAFLHQTDTSVWLNGRDLDDLKISLRYYGNFKDLRPGHYPIVWTEKYSDKPAQFIVRMNQVISSGDALPPSMIFESVKQGIINERTRSILEAEKIRLVREAKEKGNANIP
jgi:hypothetical protein